MREPKTEAVGTARRESALVADGGSTRAPRAVLHARAVRERAQGRQTPATAAT